MSTKPGEENPYVLNFRKNKATFLEIADEMDDMLVNNTPGTHVVKDYLDHKPYLHTARAWQGGVSAERDSIEKERRRLKEWRKFLEAPDDIDEDSEFLAEMRARHQERVEAMGGTVGESGEEDGSPAKDRTPAGGMLSQTANKEYTKHVAKTSWQLLRDRTHDAAARQREDREWEGDETKADDELSDDDGDEFDDLDPNNPDDAARLKARKIRKWAKKVKRADRPQGPGPALSSLTVTMLAGSSVASSSVDGDSLASIETGSADLSMDLSAGEGAGEERASLRDDSSINLDAFGVGPGAGYSSDDSVTDDSFRARAGSFDSASVASADASSVGGVSVGETFIAPLPPPAADDDTAKPPNIVVPEPTPGKPAHVAIDVG